MAEQHDTFREPLPGPDSLDPLFFTTGSSRTAPDFFFAQNPLAMFAYDHATLRLLAVNDCALEQYGYTREEFLSLSLNHLLNDPTPMVQDPSAPEDFPDPAVRVERHRTSAGGSLTVEIRERRVESGGRALCLVVAADITEDKKEQARWQTIAMQDSLTGLANRISLEERARQALITARRNGHRVAILCIDLDRFKQINDWYGHSIGDECLKELGTRLTRRLRGMDVVARVGGEEFTVVLAEVESTQSALVVANFLLGAIGKTFEVENHSLTMGASIGVAVYPDHGTETDELQRLADLAMYRAKRAGGNRAFVAEGGAESNTEDGSIESNIRAALANESFQLHYQLEYRPNGTVRAMEALLRLPRIGGGFVDPERFIPVAEETGLIYPIGYWVLGQACRQLKAWNTPGREPVRIAVNVSPLQLLRPDYAVSVMNVVQQWDIDPGWLELEITERVVVNFDEVAKGMRLLHAQGVRFAIDDFGTGYSSLQHLNRLPISTVKIDRSFVNRICDANGSYPIVEAIVAMGHSLKMEVIAEGVEMREQRLALERIGVDGMQGHLLARPASIAEIEAILELSSEPDGFA